jgi:FAD-dependent oxidoreductase domain-containing protein 1
MSLYGADFIRNAKEHFGDICDVNFTPYGYLMLASESSAETLQRNSKLQNELGARNELLTAKRLKEKFPWLNTDGIELGCHGLEKEGWFDPWALLSGLKNKALEYGAHYVNGEVIGFEYRAQPDLMVEGLAPGSYEGLERLLVKMPDGEIRPIKFAICIIAAGPHSGNVSRMARIGTGKGMLSVPLPVEPRKRYVYSFHCENEGPGLNTPMTIDPTHTYFRREGLSGLYIAGRSPPTFEDEPGVENLDVDYQFFDDHIWPILGEDL